jgi:homoserine O-acetyltransferase/O-succinyltransferase
MDPQAYVARTRLMDSFDVRDRAAPPGVDITFVGISSDWLFRPQEIRAAAKRFNARYLELESTHGHDAFLAEGDRFRELLAPVTLLR